MLRIVRRNLGQILLTLIAAVTLAVLYLVLTKPLYTASSALFIDPRTRKVMSDDVIQSGTGTDTALFESQVSIIGSDAILRRVVTGEQLTADPEFLPTPRVGLLSRLRDAVTGERQPIGADAETGTLENLAKQLRVRRAQNTYVVSIDMISESPVKAARLANAVALAYLDDQSAAKSDAAQKANRLIDGRLDELKSQLRLAETGVDEFKRTNKIVTSEGGMLNEQQLTRLNTELVAVRALVASTKAKLDELNALLRRGITPESLPEAMTSTVLQRLREQFSTVARREASLASQLQSRHPVLVDARAQLASVRGQIASELQRVAAATESDYQIASGREREIQRALARTEGEVSATTTSQIKLRELEREAEAAREILRAFLARAKETQEQQNLTIPDARIISAAAVPSRPSSPRPLLALGIAVLGGLGLALLRAMLAEQARARSAEGPIVTPQHMLADPGPATADAAGKTFASLPMLHTGTTTGRRPGWLGRRTPRPVTLPEVMTAIADGRRAEDAAFRAGAGRATERLRALARQGAPQIVLMVSDMPGAGTSTAALALAYSAALAGTRTLLVDAASAHPLLSTTFAGDLNQEHACVLDNKDDLAAITSQDPRSGLYLLPIALAGLDELAESQRQRLAVGIGRLAADYDLVVVDGGALVRDGASGALAGIATQVIAVRRAGSHARSAADALASLGVPRDRFAGEIVTMASANGRD